MVRENEEFYKIEFTPNQVGQYFVEIESSHGLIEGLPLFIDVYDPDKIKIISKPKQFVVGSENIVESMFKLLMS